MDSKTFLIVNGLLIGLVVLSFFVLRKGPRPPVKLELRDDPTRNKPLSSSEANSGNGDTTSQMGTSSTRPPGWDNYRPRPSNRVEYHSAARNLHTGTEAKACELIDEKSLNVMFNWNGHSWDAYEVLGLPAGSSRTAVAAAFQRMSLKSDPESLPFLEAAYKAICKS